MESLVGAGAAGIATIVICAVILGALMAGLSMGRSHRSRGEPPGEIVRFLPVAAVSLGIFGTFLGIYLGLKNFDTANLNASIPDLLEGMKTAFLTSLVGMFSGLVLRAHGVHLQRQLAGQNTDTADDPVELLRAIDRNTRDLNEMLKGVGDALIRCFKADDDYSLVSQLKLIRVDIGDLKRDVTKALDNFAEKVAQLGTEALVNSLREVIEQFNARLSDLVGAEFRQLRDAMVKLVEWQESYRSSVTEMQIQLGNCLTAMRESAALLERTAAATDRSAQNLDSIDGSLSQMAVSASDIAAHVEALKAQNASLSALLEEVRRLGEQAGTVLPNVTTHLNEATSGLGDTAKAMKESLATTALELQDAVKQVGARLDDVVQRHDTHTQKTIKDLEAALEKTLTTSLSSLGGQLASLSSKFAQDYTPLTERLREVVRLSEGVRSVPPS